MKQLELFVSQDFDLELILEAWYTTKNNIKIFVTSHEEEKIRERGIPEASIKKTIEKAMPQLMTWSRKQDRVFVLSDRTTGVNVVGRWKGAGSWSIITVMRKKGFRRTSTKDIQIFV